MRNSIRWRIDQKVLEALVRLRWNDPATTEFQASPKLMKAVLSRLTDRERKKVLMEGLSDQILSLLEDVEWKGPEGYADSEGYAGYALQSGGSGR